jgi:uncharacterized repeat protein (TIGR01451 family)
MNIWKIAIIVALLFFSVVSAECPEVVQEKYPGWKARNTTGNMSINATVRVEDFNIGITRVITTDVIEILVLKHSSEYIRISLQAGPEYRLERDDIMIELHSANESVANLTVYTPHRANLTLAWDVITETDKKYTIPNEIFTLSFTINNTGELEAKNIVITPQFGDFQILESDIRTFNLCQGSSEEFEYKLKVPDIKKPFSYTLYLRMDYYDENLQLGRVQDRSQYYSIPIAVKTAVIDAKKKAGNWTLKEPGRRINVNLHLNNSGNLDAYKVIWEDVLPPQLKVVQGTSSWSGNLREEQSKHFYYELVSDSPIMCSDRSRVKYEDRFGNVYESFSNNVSIRFSPFLEIEKEIDGIKWQVNPIRNIMSGVTTWGIDEDKWWENRASETVVDSPKNVWINRTANVTVRIKNRGNTFARGVIVKEVLDGVEAKGTTSWTGDLAPDEEMMIYSYEVEATRHGNLTLRTDVGYIDVAPASLKYGREFEDKCACYCTDKMEEVNFSSREKFFGLYPDLNITFSAPKKILSDCEFDLNVTLEANGSDSIHDISLRIDSPLDVLKGQIYHYLYTLKARYYPDGGERGWYPTSITYEYTIRTPKVENQTNFTISALAAYSDLYDREFSRAASAKVIVVPPKPPVIFVVIEKKEIGVFFDYANETDIEEYGEGKILLKNKGFAPLENISVRINLPKGIEFASNDTAWTGRLEATLPYANTTWYIYTGNIEWNGSLAVREEKTIHMLLRGLKSGLYEIPYTITYNGNEIKGIITLKVKGAILTVTKEVSNATIKVGEEVNITLTVENIGEASALNVVLSDSAPLNFELVEGKTTMTRDEVMPGEVEIVEYRIRALRSGSYPVDPATIKWEDKVGNMYTKASNELRIEVLEEVKPLEEVVREVRLSRKQVVLTTVFSIIILLVILKTLTLTKPVGK